MNKHRLQRKIKRIFSWALAAIVCACFTISAANAEGGGECDNEESPRCVQKKQKELEEAAVELKAVGNAGSNDEETNAEPAGRSNEHAQDESANSPVDLNSDDRLKKDSIESGETQKDDFAKSKNVLQNIEENEQGAEELISLYEGKYTKVQAYHGRTVIHFPRDFVKDANTKKISENVIGFELRTKYYKKIRKSLTRSGIVSKVEWLSKKNPKKKFSRMLIHTHRAVTRVLKQGHDRPSSDFQFVLLHDASGVVTASDHIVDESSKEINPEQTTTVSDEESDSMESVESIDIESGVTEQETMPREIVVSSTSEPAPMPQDLDQIDRQQYLFARNLFNHCIRK